MPRSQPFTIALLPTFEGAADSLGLREMFEHIANVWSLSDQLYYDPEGDLQGVVDDLQSNIIFQFLKGRTRECFRLLLIDESGIIASRAEALEGLTGMNVYELVEIFAQISPENVFTWILLPEQQTFVRRILTASPEAQLEIKIIHEQINAKPTEALPISRFNPISGEIEVQIPSNGVPANLMRVQNRVKQNFNESIVHASGLKTWTNSDGKQCLPTMLRLAAPFDTLQESLLDTDRAIEYLSILHLLREKKSDPRTDSRYSSRCIFIQKKFEETKLKHMLIHLGLQRTLETLEDKYNLGLCTEDNYLEVCRAKRPIEVRFLFGLPALLHFYAKEFVSSGLAVRTCEAPGCSNLTTGKASYCKDTNCIKSRNTIAVRKARKIRARNF